MLSSAEAVISFSPMLNPEIIVAYLIEIAAVRTEILCYGQHDNIMHLLLSVVDRNIKMQKGRNVRRNWVTQANHGWFWLESHSHIACLANMLQFILPAQRRPRVHFL